jgi:L-iditol 2-dehydrogenase
MVEALAVVVHACRRVDVRAGQNVLICGAGPVGIMSFLCAKAFGAAKVFITDINNSRLDLAKKLGVDGVYRIDPKTFNDKEAANTIRELMGAAPDITIECSGVESSTNMAIFATKSGGKVGIVGLGPKASVPLSSAAMREVDLIGVCRIKDE